MCSLEGGQQILLGHFLHLTFHHHDVLLGSTYHQVHIGLLKLLPCGVDDELAVYASHSNLRDGALEWYVAGSECC